MWRIESLKDLDISIVMEIVRNRMEITKEVKRAASSNRNCYLRLLPYLYNSKGLLWQWETMVPRICVLLKLQSQLQLQVTR